MEEAEEAEEVDGLGILSGEVEVAAVEERPRSLHGGIVAVTVVNKRIFEEAEVFHRLGSDCLQVEQAPQRLVNSRLNHPVDDTARPNGQRTRKISAARLPSLQVSSLRLHRSSPPRQLTCHLRKPEMVRHTDPSLLTVNGPLPAAEESTQGMAGSLPLLGAPLTACFGRAWPFWKCLDH